jgi:hypothetical protein
MDRPKCEVVQSECQDSFCDRHNSYIHILSRTDHMYHLNLMSLMNHLNFMNVVTIIIHSVSLMNLTNLVNQMILTNVRIITIIINLTINSKYMNQNNSINNINL